MISNPHLRVLTLLFYTIILHNTTQNIASERRNPLKFESNG